MGTRSTTLLANWQAGEMLQWFCRCRRPECTTTPGTNLGGWGNCRRDPEIELDAPSPIPTSACLETATVLWNHLFYVGLDSKRDLSKSPGGDCVGRAQLRISDSREPPAQPEALATTAG